MTDLTRPEKCAALSEAQRLKRQLLTGGLQKNSACWACVHRAGGFDRVQACGHEPAKEFPRCLDDPRGFEVDDAVLYGVIAHQGR